MTVRTADLVLLGHRRAGVRALGAAALATALSLLAPATARDRDHDRAQQQRGAGQIVPLDRVLQQISAALTGRMIKVELSDSDGRSIYEIRWLLEDGRMIELEIDAVDGGWLSMEGARLESAFRRRPLR